ncbi:MAG: hypothetical protein KatS3mg068_1948 [Candidatus Sericytochromatia bacterium]|nr:MAG: hypothetical protein KatS3mg068_1948 [Candidatus Sericytochromatia bacterium]
MPSINPWHIIYSIRAVNAWQKMINSNIVGATRVGYKDADLFFKGGATQVAYGPGGALRQVAEQSLSVGYTNINFSQGAITHSSDWAHVAINGPGFFYATNDIVAPKKENLNYTRDGQFYVDADGVLRTKEGLYVLDGTQIPGVSDPTSEWYPPWNGSIFWNWIERNKLRVRNNTTKDLTKETVVELTVDTQDLFNKGKVQSDLADLRIGYYDYTTGTWTSVPIEIVGPMTPSANTKIRFRLQKDLSIGESVTDEYFLFSKYLDTPVTGNVQTITQSTFPPTMTTGKNIGTVDPDGILDDFTGVFNPVSDSGSTVPGATAPEDWMKAVGQTGNLWRVGLPDSTSDSWPGLAAGSIDYVQGTGYQFNTGSQEIYRVADSSRPNGWKFVDELGNEITMKVIDGTNNNGNANPSYDFTLSDIHNSGTVDSSGNYVKYTLNDTNTSHRQWEEFKPTDLNPSWNKPDLAGVPYNPSSGTYGGWGQTPYVDNTNSLTTGDITSPSGTAWQGSGSNNNFEYLLVRQPIYVGTEGLIRGGGSLDLDGFVNKNVAIILRKPDGSYTTLYNSNSPSGVTTFSGVNLDYSQLQPGINWLEVYASKDVATTSPMLIPLDTTSGLWNNAPTAGSISYTNGTGYVFNNEQLYLKKTYDSNEVPQYEIVDALGNKPQMEILTNVTQEQITLKGIPQNPGSTVISTGSVIPDTSSPQTSSWINRTNTSISMASDNTNGIHPNPEAYEGQGYWHDLDDSYRLGGEVHFSNTINFNQTLLENDATGSPTLEEVNISGKVFAQDGWNLSVMKNNFDPPDSKTPYGTGDWTMDGYALGLPDSFPDTPESDDPNVTRVHTVGDLAKLSAVGVTTKVTATNESQTAFNESITSSQFSETSTFLLSGLTGKVGVIKDDEVAYFESFDHHPLIDITLADYGWTTVVHNGTINWNLVSTPVSQRLDNDPLNLVTDSWQYNLRFSNASGTSYESIKTIINEGFESASLPAGWTVNITYGNSNVQWRTSTNTAQSGSRSAYFGTTAGNSYALGPDAAERLDVFIEWDPSIDDIDLRVTEPDGYNVYWGDVHYGKVSSNNNGNFNAPLPNPPGGGVWDQSYFVTTAARQDGNPGSTAGTYKIYADGVVGAPGGGGNVNYVVIEDGGTSRGKVQTSGSVYVPYGTVVHLGDFIVAPNQRVGGELISPTIDMTGLVDGVLEFYDSFQVETQDTANYDKKKLYVWDGSISDWTDITSTVSIDNTSSSQGWVKHTYNLPSSLNNRNDVKFKFEFDSIDGRYNNFRGWNIDNFKITAKERVSASVISPTIDLTDYVTAKLTFKDFFQNESSVSKDLKQIYYAVDNGGPLSWHLLRDENSYLNTHLNYSPYTGSRDWKMNDVQNVDPGPIVTNHTPSTHIDIPTNVGASSYKIKLKFTFDSVDGANNAFAGWSLDDIKVTGSKYEDVRDTWAGGSLPNANGNGPGIWSDDITVTGRTIGATTTVDRYVIRTDPDGKVRVYDRFGDGDHNDSGETPNYGHTGGSTQKTNLDNNHSSTGDNYNFYDYVPEYSNTNSHVAVYEIDTDVGLAITNGQDMIRNSTPSVFDENGIQSIDNFRTLPRYYVNGSGQVIDRFGDGTKTNNANTYMTSNDDGVLSDEFASGGDDENLIDYDPNVELDTGINYLNVPLWTKPMLVQAGNVANGAETVIVVGGTGENIGSPDSGDGNQYQGSEEWNDYIAQFRFGVSNPSVNTNVGITAYMRYVDNNNWVRIRYDHETNPANSRLYLEYKNNGNLSTVASVPFHMSSPVDVGADVKFVVQGERYEVYVNDVLMFNERISNAPLYGKFGFGADRTMWSSYLNLIHIPPLQAQFLGDGLIRPTSAQDIIDQLYLAIFPAEKGLKYSRGYGGTYFQQTEDSLKPWPGKPGVNAGSLEAYSLEQSNVDVAKKMTHLATSKNVFDILMKQWTIFDQQFEIGLNLIK